MKNLMDTELKPSLWLRHRGALLIGLITILAIAALWRFQSGDLRVAASELVFSTATRKTLVRTVRGTGVLVPREVRAIGATVSGRVDALSLSVGSAVQSDSVLLTLDNPDLSDALAAAEAELEAALADRSARETELRNAVLAQRATVGEAQANWRSTQSQVAAEAKMKGFGVISAIQSEQTRFKAEQLQQRLALERERETNMQNNIPVQLKALDARIRQLQGKRALAAQRVEALKVRAGLAGVLQSIAVAQGQQIALGTELARIASVGDLIAQVQVPEGLSEGLQPGLRAQLRTSAGEVQGRVTRVDPSVRDGAIAADVAMDQQLAGARPEMSVEVTFEIDQIRDVLVLARPVTQLGKRARVFVVDSASPDRATAREIEIGRQSMSEVEVINGLLAGEKVVVSRIVDGENETRIRLQ